MIHTGLADVSALLNEEQYLHYYHRVPKFRREKADRLCGQADKALSVGVWVLLQEMRTEYGIEADASFNLSHSGTYVLCSINSGKKDIQVGCDIEEIKQSRLSVAKRFFCESEYRYIMAQPSEREQIEAFYRYWVLKESFMKMTKLGMKLGMDQFQIEMEGEVILKKIPENIRGDYYFKEYLVADIPYRIAVCSNSNQFCQEICQYIL